MNKYFIFYILFLVTFYACEEPIVLKLPDGDPRTTIDANVSTSEFTSRVILSKSLSFNTNELFPSIENASIVLDKQNSSESFNFTWFRTNGTGSIYTAPSDMKLVSGDTYDFFVYLPGDLSEEDTIYQAEMKMPSKVLIDSIRFVKKDNSPTDYLLRIYFTDPEKVRNFYSWRVSRKSKGEFRELNTSKIPLFSDIGVDGKSVHIEYTQTSFLLQDTLQVHFKSIQDKTYEYYVTLNNIIDVSGTNNTVENPPSNFISSAGDLSHGFFSLESVEDSDELVVLDSLL
ncbi:DUF4249 family protein [Flammeovirga kamogawensis]|uniref:DUF4249 domain-containing protein n=1 Tax=Flammeovirga kamogawensis TaxID=373891 RepID=A0ABX8GZC4_9BACT|nr:DUF4249 family protein [Flammeovirga kamogawensis]MBB6459178.1 hypothetical protein [Flammeovirga kamogawensis]QWG08744.1 DUF4249 domain-containing protein [Flammeovirga kamogawensis]TRX67037.1 DUF4249 family protein [Flammeovirga kamogawensis]